MIENWQNPTAIYLFIPWMAVLLCTIHHLLWKNLRPVEVCQKLADSPLPPETQKLRRNLFTAEILCFLGSTSVLLLLPPESVGLNLLFVICINLVLAIGLYRSGKSSINKILSAHPQISENLNRMADPPHRIPQWLQFGGFLTGMALIIVSLMAPQGQTLSNQFSRPPLQLTILLDLSQSMNARDIHPSRLDWARHTLTKLLSEAAGDTVGLAYFTDTTLIQAPQTKDLDTIKSFIYRAQTDEMPTKGTDLVRALETALPTFEATGLRHLLVVSDGESHINTFEEVLAKYKSKQIKIDVLAIGTEEGTTLLDSSGDALLYQNAPIHSSMAPLTLRKIAAATDGVFVQTTDPADAAAQLTNAWASDRISAQTRLGTSLSRLDLSPVFLYLAYFLWILSMLLSVFANRAGGSSPLRGYFIRRYPHCGESPATPPSTLQKLHLSP